MSGLLGTDKPLFAAHDAALVDLDGVVYRGPQAIPTAPAGLDAAREAGMSIVFVTNNASREPGTVADHLTVLGMPTQTHEVLTAAQAVSRMVAEELPAGSTILVVGGPGLRTALTEVGMTLVESADPTPDAVVQGFHPDVSWKDMAEASYAITAGARFFASNRDLTIPNDRGTAPGNGALVNVVVTATGVQPPSAGKPAPEMFRLAAAQAGAQRPMVIGDRLDTDLMGGNAAGFPGLLVLTGVNDGRDALLAPAGMRPSYIGRDLGCLAHPHPAPERDGDGWRVRNAFARVTAAQLEVSGDGELDRLRAACAATWEAADAGIAVNVEGVTGIAVAS
ncbi:HAD-IIA family hydrolase [Demequina litorisediminis]|uniref:Haloacid dehalogenase n=1 Tax=Demequina litorisediminis TaxID=1849022 RepID=A0ABQ6IHY1_9MICO|nr:HAD-IIA family hydrolase [Demequina litorisediminis]GMA37339.1 haloacid dehalogenase [Demequina litorisediminis]